MASSTSSKPRCATCKKVLGSFTCRGCSSDFCLQHAGEHRQLLTKKMDEEVVLLHDQLQECFNEYISNPQLHPLVKQVNEWENQSIEHIRLVADNIRKDLLRSIEHHVNNIKNSSVPITQCLTRARNEDDFFEDDINDWKKKIEDLKKELNVPTNVRIKQDGGSTSFIPKISLEEDPTGHEIFDKILGGISIEENGQVVTHDSTTAHAAVRGKDEYSSGQHRLRLQIERLGAQKWILFGIISKSAPFTPEALYNSPYSCDWGGHDGVFTNGTYQRGLNGYKTDIEVNDVVTLFIDCNRRKISRTNERTGSNQELDIDLTKCPFPWQLSLNIYDPETRIRIL